ncbi:hypothetical protein KVA01_16200 [Kocuria varians]|uniref:Uncharacterized protein n=1 Tax=Kocuria varians TaxID=1272 RepID=A0A4Y4D2P3_KOCVA|nr:hypothetical protein KVA01_16200 [Kocuria varians]
MNTGLRPIRSASMAHAGIVNRATKLASTETHSIVERSRPTTEVAKDRDHTRNTTFTVLMSAAAAIRSTAALWYLNITDSGVAGFSSGISCWASSKAGGSSRWRRIRYAVSTTTAEIQNGTRQPQLKSCSSESSSVNGMNTAVASRVPNWVPCSVHEVVTARWRSSACSRDTEIALACSPEAESPWITRHSTSSTGASIPTWP